MKFIRPALFSLLFAVASHIAMAASLPVKSALTAASDFPLVVNGRAATIVVDSGDAVVVRLAAGLLATDIETVTGIKPEVINSAGTGPADRPLVLIGTVNQSSLIKDLVQRGKLDAKAIEGKWESFLITTVADPLPGVARALVIAGSDRRGTAYGVFEMSEAIGVSPWAWWADLAPQRREALVLAAGTHTQGPPSVKFRGIFLNDEDWGLEPWAAKTFEPEQGNIGPKTYAKVFELLLRLKANYLWPAMHPVTTEFARIPANVTLADDWGIVMGASHTEAMNRNNVLWPKEGVGEWRYDTNRDNLLAYWEQGARQRGAYEAVWTLGIRGVHDSAMLGPPDLTGKMHLVEEAIEGQRTLLQRYVNPDLRQVPQLFAPYKEVLDLYRHGMKVPDDVTILWTDDNFGYIRQLSTLDEQKRAGAAGVYYHISYLGRPRSYVWLNTTPPALIWEEMSKAYDYGANRIWVANVGDIKPNEIGMEFFLRLGWDAHAYDSQSIAGYLTDWATRDFGLEHGPAIAEIMSRYYRLGFARKPEAMNPPTFNSAEARQRLADYDALVQAAETIERQLPASRRDAFYELVLYPVRICAAVNHVFLAADAADAMKRIEAETDYYNNTLASGKWRHLMTVKGTTSPIYAFKWPDPSATPIASAPPPPPAEPELSIFAGHFTRNIARSGGEWRAVAGLGRQADALTVFPPTLPSVAPEQAVRQAPELDYDFTSSAAGPLEVTVYAVPTHRINETRGQRYAVAIDDGQPQIVDFEQFSGDSTNPAWQQHVIHNASVTRTQHTVARAGAHTLKVFMVDPGVVLEKFVVSSRPLPDSEFGPPETIH